MGENRIGKFYPAKPRAANDTQAAIRALGVALSRLSRMVESGQEFTPEGLERAEVIREGRGIIRSYLMGLERMAAIAE